MNVPGPTHVAEQEQDTQYDQHDSSRRCGLTRRSYVSRCRWRIRLSLSRNARVRTGPVEGRRCVREAFTYPFAGFRHSLGICSFTNRTTGQVVDAEWIGQWQTILESLRRLEGVEDHVEHPACDQETEQP